MSTDSDIYMSGSKIYASGSFSYKKFYKVIDYKFNKFIIKIILDNEDKFVGIDELIDEEKKNQIIKYLKKDIIYDYNILKER